MQNNQVGTIIAIAGMIASVLAHYNIIIPQDGIVAVISGAVALYGIIHQMTRTNTVVASARAAGAHV